MNKLFIISSVLSAVLFLSGCQATGEQYAANVYKADQVNQKQEAKTVKILAIMPAKIEVDNIKAKQNAQLIGGLLGAVGGAALGNTAHNYKSQATAGGAIGGGALGLAAGSAFVKDKILVDGVSLTYTEDNKTLNSVQVGQICEFALGTALIIATSENETRIQPNATCPEKKS